jgi:hypothetical protein
MENAKLNDAAGALVVMRSIDQGANPQVPINQPILTFPATPDALSEMTGTLLFPCFPFFQANVLRSARMSRYPQSP